jgi:hypothetical protein
MTLTADVLKYWGIANMNGLSQKGGQKLSSVNFVQSLFLGNQLMNEFLNFIPTSAPTGTQ